MLRPDPAGIAYTAAAVALLGIALVTWRRRALNPTVARALVVVTLATSWWAVADAVAVCAVDARPAGVGSLAMFPGQSATVAAFVYLAGTIARTHGAPGRGVVALLLVEPVLITVATATNPWHQLVYAGAGASTLTGSASWGFGPLVGTQSAYGYSAMALGIALVGYAWWTAPSAFRAQRLCLLLAVLLAVLVPVAGNAANLAGALPTELHPTPIALAVTGLVMAYVIFSQHLFTFTPIARALIIEQVDDAIVAVSPMGVVIDLNPAAASCPVHRSPRTPAAGPARGRPRASRRIGTRLRWHFPPAPRSFHGQHRGRRRT